MASDSISVAVGDGSRRMTYAELAEARNISIPAARRLTLRHHWHKQIGNDGLVIVSVPPSALEKPRKPAAFSDPMSRHSVTRNDATSDPVRDARSDAKSDIGSDPVSDTTRDPAIRALEHAVEGLREQLDRAEQQAVALRAERAEAQVGERHAIELVKHVTAEASEQRKRVDALHTQLADAQTAERISRDEAAGLRTRLDQLQARGLWARLRNKR